VWLVVFMPTATVMFGALMPLGIALGVYTLIVLLPERNAGSV
jgi:hypothetical protein